MHCAGEVYGEREKPLQSLGFRDGDHCVSCGAYVLITMIVPVAPGVPTMQDFANVRRAARN